MLEPERLSENVETLIAERTNRVHLSPVSVWESLVLARKGRIVLRPDPLTWVREALQASQATMVPLTHDIAMRSEDLDLETARREIGDKIEAEVNEAA